VWADGVGREIIFFVANGNNYIEIGKLATNQLSWSYKSGGVHLNVQLIATPTTQMCLGMTWSKTNDSEKAFYNGLQTGATQVGLGVWAGALGANTTLIGASSLVPANVWYGYLGEGVLLNREASPAEMLKAAQL
jgi:hypothetical protein